MRRIPLGQLIEIMLVDPGSHIRVISLALNARLVPLILKIVALRALVLSIGVGSLITTEFIRILPFK